MLTRRHLQPILYEVWLREFYQWQPQHLPTAHLQPVRRLQSTHFREATPFKMSL